MPGHIIILSGPSRSGKDTALQALRRDKRLRFTRIVTYTTRPKRAEERNGIDHYFVSPATFRSMIREKAFLEWARVRGAYFGTPLSSVKRALSRGKQVLLKIDLQGMRQVRRLFPTELTTIFLKPHSIKDVERRLKQGGFSSVQRRIRLAEARREIAAAHEHDIVLINKEGELDELIRSVKRVVRSLQRRRR